MIAALVHKVGDPLAFYTVAATVIPVLFVALVFEAKAFAAEDSSTERWMELASALGIVAFALVGEVAALKVLATQHPSTAAKSTVVLSLILTSLGVLFKPLADLLAPIVKASKSAALAVLLVAGVLGVLICAGLWGASR